MADSKWLIAISYQLQASQESQETRPGRALKTFEEGGKSHD